MFDCKKVGKLIGVLALALLFCAQAYAQRQSQGSTAQGSGTETPAIRGSARNVRYRRLYLYQRIATMSAVELRNAG